MADDLARVLAADIADLGLAESAGPGRLKSLEDGTLVELEQEGDAIRVSENGDEIAEYLTTDPQFNEKLMATLATALNF